MISANDEIQGTVVAPQDTAIAPQGTAAVPQATSAAPTAPTASDGRSTISPDISGKIISAGSQADIVLVRHEGKDYAMRWYKPGSGLNKEIGSYLSRLNGKGFVADILATGTKGGREYEIMPYYPLGSVADYDLRGRHMEILTIAVKTAMGLDAIHKVHLVHKDIKPANILLADMSNWDTVICDFGIAGIVSGGKCVTPQSRTPIYAAPELYDPKKVVARVDGQDMFEISPAADFYSLGMTILSLWYGEKAFLGKEQEMAVSKLKGGVKIPEDMPGTLACMVRGLLEKDPKKRWGFKEIRDMLVPEALGDYGVRLFLNPLCDIRLNPDPKSPDYIATGEQIGKFLNDIYLWHFTGTEAPADEKLCDLVLDSFEEYEDSYLETYFDSKGDFFKQYSVWMRKCIDNDYNTKKISPSDPHQRFQISMMKAIKGFGFTPEYRFSDSGETITDIEGLNNAEGDKKKALEDGGLRGWLAVQFQEDPDADFSEHFAYENALLEYVYALEECDPDCEETGCLNYALDKQDEVAGKVKKVLRGTMARRYLQCILSLIGAAVTIPVARSFIEMAGISPGAGYAILDHIWIFGIIGLAAGVFVFFRKASILLSFLCFGAASFISMVLAKLATDQMMWVLAVFSAAAGVYALVIAVIALWRDRNAMSPSEVDTQGEDMVLECLDYVFNDAEDFDTSLNGFLTDGRLYWWKKRLDKNRIRIIVCFCCIALAAAGSLFLIKTDIHNPTSDETIETVQ